MGGKLASTPEAISSLLIQSLSKEGDEGKDTLILRLPSSSWLSITTPKEG